MAKAAKLTCPLCGSVNMLPFHADKFRAYFRCTLCLLVFVPPAMLLNRQQEKAVYDLHQNNPSDSGYRRFLSRLFVPLSQRLPAGAQGLDFGCGPGPTLAGMFTAEGYKMQLYDPYYANDWETLYRHYDFITCSEVIEHLHHPGREIERLFFLLKKHGYLGIMTKLVINQHAFINWHYKNDPTHVCFFSRETFHWLQTRYRCQVEIIGSDVIIIRKTL